MTDKDRLVDWDSVRARMAASDQALGEALEPAGARLQAILAERARHLAERRRDAGQKSSLAWVLCFLLGEERYGIELAQLREILRVPRVTAVPGAGRDVVGVANIHGEITPVLDPTALLGTAPGAPRDGGHLLDLRMAGGHAAIVVDGIAGVRRIDISALHPQADGADETRAALIKGVTEDLMAMIDAPALVGASSIARPAGRVRGANSMGDER